MKSKTKKSYLIITILLACVFCIVGLFFAFRSDEKKTLTASAVSSDSENFYFASGANIQTNTLELRVRFTLKIHQDVYDGLLNSVDDWFIEVKTPKKDTITFTYGEDNTSWLSDYRSVRYYNDDIFWSGEWGTLYIYLSVDYDTEVSLIAELCEDYTIGYGVHETAYSDARSYSYIYDKYMESGSSGATVISNVRAEQFKAYNASVDKTALALSENAWLDSYNGLSFILNVPQEYLNLIAKGEFLATDTPSRKIYEQYMLVEMNVESGFDLTSTAFDVNDDGIITSYREMPSCFNSGTTALIQSPQLLSGNRVFGVIKKERVQVATWSTEYQGDIYYGNWQDESETYTAIDWTDKICNVNFTTLATEILESTDLELSESEMAWLQDLGGIKADTEEVLINLEYQYLSESSNPASITTIDGVYFNVKSVYAFSKTFVEKEMYRLKNRTHISDFNVVYEGQYHELGEDGETFTFKKDKRVILQAKGLSYEYNAETKQGTLKVVYDDYQYSDFCMRISSNDTNSHLEMVYYPTANPNATNADEKDILVDDDGKVTLRFRYEKISSEVFTSAGWIFKLTADDIQVLNNENVWGSEIVTVNKTDEMIEIVASNQTALKNIALTATAEIIPDFECEVDCEYVALSVNGRGELVEEVKRSEPVATMYSQYKRWQNFDNVMKKYGDVINGELECSSIIGEYMTPIDILPRNNGDGTFTYVVRYAYNTMFKITNTYNDTVLYKALNDVSSLYYGEFFVDTIPTGWRVKAINALNDDVRITVDESVPDDYTKTKIKVLVDANEQYLIPIEVDMTDEWDLIINYFEMYKRTPFAVKTQATKTIKVLDYPNIYKLSKEDLAKILGKQNMVVGIGKSNVDVDTINVTFDGVSVYTADVSYGYETFRVKDYEGNTKELKVPLISYAEWCNGFDKDWSILYLNEGDDKHYFDYSNEVKYEDLYGFFFVAVFEEQVSDFNRFFRNMNSEGEVTIFDERTVKGSAFYEFSYRLYDSKNILDKIVGYVCMTFCEIFDDDNQMVYSYFGYLDGTSEYAYMSNGGADDAFDDDTASENFAQDVGDAIKDIWDDIKGSGQSFGDWIKEQWQKFRASNWDTVVFVVLGVAGGLLVIGLGWKWGKRYYLWVTAKPKTAPKKSTSKKSTTKKTTAKGKKK